MIKKFIYITFLLFCANVLTAQKIKLLNGNVYLNNEVILKYERRNFNSELKLFSLNTNEEIADFVEYRSRIHINGGFKKLYFTKQNFKVESTRLKSRGWKYTIKVLLEENVISSNGKILPKNFEKFSNKYHENLNEMIDVIQTPNCN
ncbi:hypothetical protein [Tenacibaculum sp. 190524A05c]|uniref:DUF4468 domain-containing protein n=1 Tax=Tenacibaculum platacis TaxID=3137852 RepID=A0ABM9P427_9FLAO